jgi:MoxR-like ATPase
MVLATQNPVEQEGTYPLPEAQLDRFLVKLIVKYPTTAEMDAILEQTTGKDVKSVTAFYGAQDVMEARAIVREVPASKQVRLFAINVVSATQPDNSTAPKLVKDYVSFGAGPRAAQALLLLAKARALLQGRYAVSCDDLRAVAAPVLRHRLVLNFAGLAARVAPDSIVEAVIRSVPELSNSEG